MGRPLNKHLFGDNSLNNIKVQFHNGTGSVRGFIVRQRSNLKFLCQDENGVQAVCKLVVKDSADLQPGEMSITVKYDDSTVRHAVKIAKNLITVAYSGINPVTGQTHGSNINGQAGWSFDTSTSDQKWQIEEAGTDTAMDNATDLEGDDIDVTYPIPGSGTFKTAVTAFTGVSYADRGTPATASGGISTVSNSASGLLRRKYNGNLGTAAGSAIGAWNTSLFTTGQHLADVVDTYISWGQQSDGPQLGQQNFSMEWLGYVKVPSTQKWNFFSQSDDDNAVWIGNNAVSGYTVSNYDLYSSNKTMPGQAAQCGASNSLTMDSTKWYPIRIWMTEYNGGCNFQLFALGQDGTKLNGPGLQFAYNTATGGF